MKILVLTNSEAFAHELEQLLIENRFEADCVHSPNEAAAYAETNIYDLLVLEVSPFQTECLEMIRQLRLKGQTLPILLLNTSGDTFEDFEISGLMAGADAYLKSPFTSQKLLAYFYALLRRQGSQMDILTLGDTSLNLWDYTLSCKDQSIRLSSREFDVMRCFLSSPGQILSKELILCRVWGFNSNAVENHVEVYVGMIRKKLRSIGSTLQITAIRRVGYLIEPIP